MRHTILLPALLLCAPLGLASCGGGQTNANGAAAANSAADVAQAPTARTTATPAAQPQEVTATVQEARVGAGGSGEATVRLDIAEGYHVHANPASDKFYVATELRAEPTGGITPGGPVYPPAVSRKLGFSDKPLSVYEGSVVIRLPLRAASDASKGRHTLRARVRVQPCNDEVCKPPRELDAPIPVTVD